MYDTNALQVPTDVYYVAVDSRFRDMSTFPTTATYIVPFDEIFKNVISVELVYALFERPTNAAAMKYASLYIEELSGNTTGNANALKGAFTQLPITDGSMNRSVIYTKKTFRSIKIFHQPLSKLSRFTIRFMNFEEQPLQMSEHFMRFEVTCLKTISVPEWKDMNVVSNSVNMFKSSGWDPKRVLGLGERYTEDDLKKAFVRKAKTYKGVDKMRYDECKKAFKELYANMQ